MQSFTHHRIDKITEDGYEITLYLDPNVEEFSQELGTLTNQGRGNIEQEAKTYVKDKLPNTKVKLIRIVGGAILLTTLAFGPLKPSTAEAAALNTNPATQQIYIVKSGDTLWLIANRHQTTVQAIMSANNLHSDFLRVGQSLVIPGGSSSPTITYTVVAGDTLSGIAVRNGTTVDAIRNTNQLTSDLIRIGQRLVVPTTSAVNSSPVSQPSTNTSTFTYTVVSGDTLSGIAARNGTTVNDIMTMNNLSSTLIRVGQQLTIPGSGTTPIAPSTQTNTSSQTQTYIVVSGDTLSSIAARNGTTVQAIKTANNLSSDFLRIGQALIIPGGVTTDQVRTSTPTESSVNQEELMWLAKMIFAEARGESLQGQIAVGAVIMNRVKSNLFPNTIRDVIFERSHGHYQFTPAGTGSIHTATPNATNMEAARRAMAGEDPTNGSLFFYNPAKTNDQWVRSRTVSTTIGNHVFAY